MGWTAEHAEDVRRRLLEAVLREDAGFLGADDYGQRYALDFPVQGTGGAATVRSLWMIRQGEEALKDAFSANCAMIWESEKNSHRHIAIKQRD